MQFTRLRLSGFKSFVDPTDLLIEPGLTAIVGPNGCGKSNLLEAIRWVMGENRVKSLRGTGMNDVIFAGTSERPQRNMAEVVLVIDNRDGSVPTTLTDSDELEVVRRIERDSGSAYRLNGQDVRAKDVTLLFADMATGAHSPALVSQGRIGELINAKPEDRRLVLEEAAGISGLHARRREAESRLKSAEGNLTRLQDVMQTMETQMSGLKRQARQAQRYKDISGEIEQAEASLLYARWDEAANQVMAFESAQRTAQSTVAERTGLSAEISTKQAELAATLPPLRDAAVEARAAFQRFKLEKDSLLESQKRRGERRQSLGLQLSQIADDQSREVQQQQEAEAATAQIDTDLAAIDSEEKGAGEALTKARAASDEAAQKVRDAEEDVDGAAQALASVKARSASLSSDLLTLNRRLEMWQSDQAEANRSLDAVVKAIEEGASLDDAKEALAAAELALQKAQEQARTHTADADEKRTLLQAAKSEYAIAKTRAKSLEEEKRLLEKRLSLAAQKGVTVASSVRAHAGYEAALAAALGGDAEASVDSDAGHYWGKGVEVTRPVWATAITPLGDYCTVPDAVAARIAMTGLVKDGRDIATLSADLLPGMQLVTRAGICWRWDGVRMMHGADTVAAAQLRDQNKLDAVLHDLAVQQDKRAARLEEEKEAALALQVAEQQVIVAQQAVRSLEKTLADSRHTLLEREQHHARQQTQLASMQDRIERLKADIQTGQAERQAVQDQVASLPDLSESESSLAALRTDLEEKRRLQSEARAVYDLLERGQSERTSRRAMLGRNRAAWAARVDASVKQLASLAERAAAAEQELAVLTDDPEEETAKLATLKDRIEGAEVTVKDSADALAVAETALRDVDQNLRQANEALIEAREQLARQEASLEAATTRRKDMASDIAERFSCAPTAVLAQVGLDPDASRPAPAVLENKLETLKTERERLGAVNLRADEELVDVEEQLDHLATERSELEQAIQRLRKAIMDLNREGRERLLAAFELVNSQFGELFVSLFGGGEAHLQLTESDDPLNAGLEIFASPPGKKLQSLSLLSGGEQALTALSLIFAVFITNPAPVCVLDEVDAPLDDANVDRFCDLLEVMRDKTDTRFLIVTHNAVTMARMDRLFGVTMIERGVSNLVSVDLERAVQLLD